MNTTLLRQNITLAYSALNVPAIDSNALKSLAGIQASRVILAPERILATYTTANLLQIDGKLIQVSLHQRDQQMGAVPLWQMAAQCHQLASAAGSPTPTLTAYGFNYGVEMALTDGSVYTSIATMLNPDAQKLKALMDGEMVRLAFTPVVVFRRGQVMYELTLSPAGEKLMRISLKVHFEHQGITLPPADQLEASYRQEFDGFTALLSRLSGEHKQE